MEELQQCPTCEYLSSGRAAKDGIGCILHYNPDKTKYWCSCDSSNECHMCPKKTRELFKSHKDNPTATVCKECYEKYKTDN